MANKELKEWRQAELKQDIEKIKSHELDLLQMGSKIVLKTHKGEEVKEQEKTEIKLPEVFSIAGCSRIPLPHFKRDCDSKPAISPIIAENQKIQRGKGQEIVLKKYPFF